MLRTLYGYITKELLRIMLLSLVAFTLVMTVFAIIEPLRKEGLATSQIAELFVYMIPVMLSLTLPIAALFATTIAYGRFAQDRELLACRASGISTIRLLRPAIVLGAIVTIITLLLTNIISPHMAKGAEEIVFKNALRIGYHKIRKDGHFRIGQVNVHAVHVDEKENILRGAAVGQMGWDKEGAFIRVWMASTVHLRTYVDPDTGKRYLMLAPTGLAGPISNRIGYEYSQEEFPWQAIEMEDITEDKPDFYDFSRLLKAYHDPSLFGEVRQSLGKIKQKIRHAQILRSVEETINDGKAYSELVNGEERFIIRAAEAEKSGDEVILRARVLADGTARRVELIARGPERTIRYTADSGKVVVHRDDIRRRSRVTVSLEGNLEVPLDENDAEAPRKLNTSRSAPLPDDSAIPEGQDPDSEQQLLRKIYNDTESFTSDPGILQEVQTLREMRVPRIRGRILAEMHSRMAFGFSGVLLVTLGAALGVMFRGGQLLSAFVLSIVPGAAVIVAIMMGKRMIANAQSSDIGGMISIWGGLVVLLAVIVILYYRLSRE